MEEKKALTAKILIAVIVVLAVAVVGLVAYMVIQNNNTKNNTTNQGSVTNITGVGSSTTVNSAYNQNGVIDVAQIGNGTTNGLTSDVVNDELVGTVAFSFDSGSFEADGDTSNINLIAIKNDTSTVEILNGRQFNTSLNGLYQIGDYAYSNGYLYFIISIDKNDSKNSKLDIETSIYSINLKDGNQSYNFTKVYTIGKVDHPYGNIKVYNNNIYFIAEFSINDCEILNYNLLTNQCTNIKTFTTYFVSFDVDKINNILYYADDNNIYIYNISTGTETLIESNYRTKYYAQVFYPITVNNSGLIYVSVASSDGLLECSQYNLKTNSTSVIIPNVQSSVTPLQLIPYNDSYIYIKSNSIYISTDNQETQLYTAINQRLSFDLIGNKLLITDIFVGESPVPNIYTMIDLTNNTKSNVTSIYSGDIVNVN